MISQLSEALTLVASKSYRLQSFEKHRQYVLEMACPQKIPYRKINSIAKNYASLVPVSESPKLVPVSSRSMDWANCSSVI